MLACHRLLITSDTASLPGHQSVTCAKVGCRRWHHYSGLQRAISGDVAPLCVGACIRYGFVTDRRAPMWRTFWPWSLSWRFTPGLASPWIPWGDASYLSVMNSTSPRNQRVDAGGPETENMCLSLRRPGVLVFVQICRGRSSVVESPAASARGCLNKPRFKALHIVRLIQSDQRRGSWHWLRE